MCFFCVFWGVIKENESVNRFHMQASTTRDLRKSASKCMDNGRLSFARRGVKITMGPFTRKCDDYQRRKVNKIKLRWASCKRG